MDREGWVEICQVERKLLEGVSRSWKPLGKEPGEGEGQFKERHFSAWTDTRFSLITWSFLQSALALTRFCRVSALGLASLTWFSSSQPPWGGLDECPDHRSALRGYL